MRFDAAPRSFSHFLDWDLVRSSVFLDLAHSRDMRSYVRLLGGFRFGVAFPREERQSVAPFFGPTAGFEARWQGRLQAATLTTAFSKRVLGNDLGWRTDLRATAEYEVVLFAVAEQPLSTVFQVNYGYDDRFGAGLPTSTFGVMAGLRLSFGAK